MASSTSHSKVPWVALLLLSAALGAWALSAAYTLWLNPELGFFRHAAHVKQAWARELTRKHTNKIVVVGGSSCAFSIDGRRMLNQHQMPTVNCGLAAGMGAKVLCEWAVAHAGPGDTLVVAIEPALLTEVAAPSSFGIQFSYGMRRPDWIRGVLEPHAPVGPGSLLALRPGGTHCFTLLGKLASHKPLYRYRASDIAPDGLIQTPVRAREATPGFSPRLSPSGQRLLASLSDWSRTNHVRVCYSLPWASAAEGTAAYQRLNAEFLSQVAVFLPVLKDESLGAKTDPDLFADTAWHLNERGVRLRTDELAAQLRDWRVWHPDELRAAAGR